MSYFEKENSPVRPNPTQLVAIVEVGKSDVRRRPSKNLLRR
jgi:hypothetical protein